MTKKLKQGQDQFKISSIKEDGEDDFSQRKRKNSSFLMTDKTESEMSLTGSNIISFG